MSRADAHSVPCPQRGVGPPTNAEYARMWAGLLFIGAPSRAPAAKALLCARRSGSARDSLLALPMGS